MSLRRIVIPCSFSSGQTADVRGDSASVVVDSWKIEIVTKVNGQVKYLLYQRGLDESVAHQSGRKLRFLELPEKR